jgi:hypothetical protein
VRDRLHRRLRVQPGAGVLADDLGDLPAGHPEQGDGGVPIFNWAANFVASCFFLQEAGLIGKPATYHGGDHGTGTERVRHEVHLVVLGAGSEHHIQPEPGGRAEQKCGHDLQQRGAVSRDVGCEAQQRVADLFLPAGRRHPACQFHVAPAGWRARTPADFVMAVKASRYLSHVRRLRDPAEPIARLLGAAELPWSTRHVRGAGPRCRPHCDQNATSGQRSAHHGHPDLVMGVPRRKHARA